MLDMNNPKDIEKFGEKIKRARKKSKDYNTLEKLADEIGVKRSSISDWEKGKKIPSINHLTTLCNTLNIDLGYLLDIYDEDNAYIHSISDITGLSEKSANVLINLGNDNKEILNLLLNNNHFLSSLNNISHLILNEKNYGHFIKYFADNIKNHEHHDFTRLALSSRCGNRDQIKYYASKNFNYALDEIEESLFKDLFGVTYQDIMDDNY